MVNIKKREIWGGRRARVGVDVREATGTNITWSRGKQKAGMVYSALSLSASRLTAGGAVVFRKCYTWR